MICLFLNNSGVQEAAAVWLHACSSQQLWLGEIILEEYKLRSLWLLKALIFIVHNILLSAFFLCTNYCRTWRLLYMTEILMCEGAVNKCILEKNIMDAGSERSQHQRNIHWDIHFTNSLVKIVMLCLVSLGLQTTRCIYISAVLSSLGKFTSKLSCTTHPVCSGTCVIS